MRKWFVRLLAATVGVGMLLGSSAALAASGPGQGLEISPPVIQLTANPGQTLTTKVSVRNVTTGALLVNGEADDFGAGTDETGTPKLLLNETGATRYSLKYWVTGVPNLTLAPGELKQNSITIRVPGNAEPGGHYAVVRFTGVPTGVGSTSGVSLSASVGALILLTVNGAITHQLGVAQFAAGQSKASDTFAPGTFYEHGPVAFLVRLQNGGSVHEAPHGTITVKDMLGHKTIQMVVNANGGNVLPGSIRRFVSTMPNKMLFGHYTASLSLAYAGNKTLSSSVGFWVIPWKLILLIIVALVVIGYLLKVGLKRYNEHIIAQARRRR